MRNKKVTVLIVLSVIAVFVLAYGIAAPPKSKGRVRQKKEDVSYGKNRKEPPVAQAQAKGHAVKSQFVSWKRRPFVPSGVPGASSNLALNGILGSGKDLKAMMGDAIVGKGDKIGNNTVVEVKKNSVILNDGAKDFELRLKE